MSSDFTTQANLDWIQSAVDSSGDATIANAWAELKADARSVMAQRDWAKGEMDRLEYADSQGRIERLVLDVSKRDEQLAAQAVEIQRLTPRRVCAAVIRTMRGDYIIGQRKPDQFMGGKWCFVGGKVEPGETLEAAVVREAKEELGLDIAVIGLRHQQLVQYDHGLFHLHYFDCTMDDNQIPALLDCSDSASVSPCRLPDYDFLPVDIEVARQIQQAAEIQVLRSNIDTLANDVHLFIPGCWRCTKCHFVLTRTSINAHTGDFGTTAADREDSEPCPNDGTEMVRVSWKERCKELGATAEQYCLETRTLQEVLAELRKYSHNSECRYILTRAVKTCDCPKGIVDDYFKTEAWRVFLKAHGIELNSEGHSI